MRPARNRVGGVFDQLPFAGFTDDQHIEIGPSEWAEVSGVAPVSGHRPDLHARIAHHSHGSNLQAVLNLFGQIAQGDAVEEELARVFGIHFRRPVERLGHACGDAIGPMRMPVIVKAEDHHLVAVQKILLEFISRIVFQRFGLVFVGVEGGLVGDHHVAPRHRRALDNAERRHHGGRDACHRRIGAAGFDGVDGRVAPGDTDVGLDLLDHLRGAERSLGIGNTRGRSGGYEAPS